MKRKTKTYYYKNKKYRFNNDGFNSFFRELQDVKNVYVKELEKEIGDAVHVSSSTVHSWRNGVNGPVDIDRIKGLAKYFRISTEDLLVNLA